MKQFKPFPIFVNDPSPTLETDRQRLRREFARKHDVKMLRWIDNKLPLINEVAIDARPTEAQKNYENAVVEQLVTVYSNLVGKMVIEQLDLIEQEVWIVPLEIGNTNDCNCFAFTFPGDPKARGGYRIYYDPEWHRDGKQWIGSDDILLHELVHAYRMARIGYFNQKVKPISNFDNGEEFLATQIQNVYLGYRGSLLFYKQYKPLTTASKREVYDYYVANEATLAAFRYFIDTERVARIISRWPAPEFNPFRDFDDLNNAYLDYMKANGFTYNYSPY